VSCARGPKASRRLPDGLKSTVPGTVVMFLAVVFLQLAENLAQWGGTTGFVESAFKDLRGVDHDMGQV